MVLVVAGCGASLRDANAEPPEFCERIRDLNRVGWMGDADVETVRIAAENDDVAAQMSTGIDVSERRRRAEGSFGGREVVCRGIGEWRWRRLSTTSGGCT